MLVLFENRNTYNNIKGIGLYKTCFSFHILLRGVYSFPVTLYDDVRFRLRRIYIAFLFITHSFFFSHSISNNRLVVIREGTRNTIYNHGITTTTQN